MIKEKFTGDYEVVVINSQGIGSFNFPITNTPYGYRVIRDGIVLSKELKISSGEQGAYDLGCIEAERLSDAGIGM